MRHSNRDQINLRGIIILAGIVLLVVAMHLFFSGRSDVPPSEISGRSDLSTPQAVVLNGISVDINTASEEEFAAIPGIGQAKAAAIVKFRDLNGGFVDVDDLLKVQGVGLKTLARTKMFFHSSSSGKKRQ